MYLNVFIIFFTVLALCSAQTGQNVELTDLMKSPSMQQLFLNFLTQQQNASQAPSTSSPIQVHNVVEKNQNSGLENTNIPVESTNPSVNTNNNNDGLNSLLNIINLPSQNEVVVPTQTLPTTVTIEKGASPNQVVQNNVPNTAVTLEAIPQNDAAMKPVVLPNLIQNNLAMQNVVPRAEQQTVVPTSGVPLVTVSTPTSFLPSIFQNLPNSPIQNNVPQNVVPNFPPVPAPIPTQVNNNGAGFLPNIFQNLPATPVQNNVVPNLPGIPPVVAPIPTQVNNNVGAGFVPNIFQNLPIQNNVPQNAVPNLPGVPPVVMPNPTEVNNNGGAGFVPNIFQNLPNLPQNVVPNLPGVPPVALPIPTDVGNIGGAAFMPNIFQNVPNPVPVQNNLPNLVSKIGILATPANEPIVTVPDVTTDSQTYIPIPTPSRVTYTPDELARYQAANAKYQFANVIDDNLTGLFMMREEVRDGLKVVGKYAYDDGYFFRSVEYEADENGYRVIKDQSIPSTKTPTPNGVALVKTYLNGNVVDFKITKNDVQPNRRVDVVPANNVINGVVV